MFLRVYIYIYTCIIGARLSEPHTIAVNVYIWALAIVPNNKLIISMLLHMTSSILSRSIIIICGARLSEPSHFEKACAYIDSGKFSNGANFRMKLRHTKKNYENFIVRNLRS